MGRIAENLEELRRRLSGEVTLVAVSKTKSVEDIREAYEAGQRIFGENRAQELAEKAEALPKDIQWHMIGHLQRNKVKYIIPHVSMVHAVDSLRLMAAIDKEAKKIDRTVPILLQFHIAEEESKYGLSLDEAHELLESDRFASFQNVEVAGVMGMATFTEDHERVRREFRVLKRIFATLKQEFFSSQDAFKEISMGMSGDYPIAIEEGSTMVRVGSSIFGERA